MAESDLRQFMRDISARHERIWREQADVLHGMLAELRALRQETHAVHEGNRAAQEQARAAQEEARAAQEEARNDHRAQLQALLHVLDRLENGGAAA